MMLRDNHEFMIRYALLAPECGSARDFRYPGFSTLLQRETLTLAQTTPRSRTNAL